VISIQLHTEVEVDQLLDKEFEVIRDLKARRENSSVVIRAEQMTSTRPKPGKSESRLGKRVELSRAAGLKMTKISLEWFCTVGSGSKKLKSWLSEPAHAI
jgi:hypothetical protein